MTPSADPGGRRPPSGQDDAADRPGNAASGSSRRGHRGSGSPTDDAWLELAVAADPEAVEAVSEILSLFAPGGTSVEAAFLLTDEGLAATVDPTRPATVRAYVPAGERGLADRAVERCRAALGHLQAFGLRPIGELEVRVVHESDWAQAWKAHFPVLRVGRRLVIRPTWRRHRAAPGDVVLALDPGMAFGTGLHPTTRLCLAGIERWADEGLLAKGQTNDPARVLDVGCGSGILAIAVAKLGSAAVLGIDIDPIAVESSLANVGRNRLARRVRVRQGRLPTGQGPFELVLANLIASLLVELGPALGDELVPGGRLLASGIFVDREQEVRAAFGAAGLQVTGSWTEGDWVALEARRSTDGREGSGRDRPRELGTITR